MTCVLPNLQKQKKKNIPCFIFNRSGCFSPFSFYASKAMHHNSLLSNLLESSIILVFFFLMYGINDVVLLFKRTSVEIIKPFNDFLGLSLALYL